MTSPLVSIIVPSFNQGRFIRETLESCLAQDYRPIEIVVVDGGSTDGTVDILHSYDDRPEIRWISEPDHGVVAAVNKGFALAKGEFGAIQSSDDCYLPGAVSQAVTVLSAKPGLGFVFGDIVKIDADGRELSTTQLGAFSTESVLAVQTWIPQPACFFRMSLTRELGGWREEVPYAADTDLWFRMMLRAGVQKIDVALAKRRVHGEQRDIQGGRIIRDYTRMIQDLFSVYGAPVRYWPAAEAGILLQMNRYGYGEPSSQKQQRWQQAVRLYPPLARSLPGSSFMSRIRKVRSQVGCWLNERWRTECALNTTLSRITGIRWQDLHNRLECLRNGGDALSRVCDWKWTSELTVCQVFPGVASRLCCRCFQDWPLGSKASSGPDQGGEPRISVIIPVGDVTRHAALMAVLASFRRQTHREYELIVVEQSPEPLLANLIPSGARYRHFPDAKGVDGFNKSYLMNEAVRMARAPWVLLHDADIVVPCGYLEAILDRARSGWEAVRPIRFLFYLDQARSVTFAADGMWPACIDRVTQNFPGGSTAIKRESYWQIGGHDERFVGWGGEDTEFLERLQECRVFPGHFAPALHLWHPPATKKFSGDRNQVLLDQQLVLPVEERIRQLRVLLRDVRGSREI